MDIPALVDRVARLELRREGVLVRRLGAGDVETAIAHQLDPRVMSYVADIPTVEEARAKVLRMLEPWSGADGEWVGLAIVPDDVGAMVGLVAFRVVAAANQSVEIGYRLHPDHYRRGYAFAACQALLDFLFGVGGVAKVLASCVADNRPSFRLMEKLGMRREGQLRRHSMLGGVWHDELVYGLFERERTNR